MTSAHVTDQSPTGTSIGRGRAIDITTRTISDLVDDWGDLRNQAKILATETSHLHRYTDAQHSDTLDAELRTISHAKSKESLERLLEQLNELGFSWRDIARVVGVSVTALRKWRLGGAATGENRNRIASVLAFCEIASSRFHLSDVVSWLESPLHAEAPITRLDMMASDRFDLVLRLVRDWDSDPQAVLDEFEPNWRDRYCSPVEVFTGPDGMPGLRLADHHA